MEDIESEAENLDCQITDIVDNQESITVELDTSEHLEEELSGKIDNEQSILEKERELEAEKQMCIRDSPYYRSLFLLFFNAEKW